ncbi:hypothetical protein HXX01_05080, partial [Candidatus Nomurabacteria bacterium]|nr:hypothetical protein [Candidatus Nomurabacteria bacterium]
EKANLDRNIIPNLESVLQYKEPPKVISEKIKWDPSDYYQSWVNCTVTLEQWRKHVNFDVILELRRSLTSIDDWNKAYNHQCTLYNEHIQNLFDEGLKKKFEAIESNQDKLLIAKRDLGLINKIISRTVDEDSAKQIKSIFIKPYWEKTATEFEDILRNKPSDDVHCNSFWTITNGWYDRKSNEYSRSAAIIKYKKYLEVFMESYEKSTKEKKQKAENLPKAYTLINIAKKHAQLTKLLNFLKDADFISDEGELTDFRNIFNNILPENKIPWIGTFEELAYFIKLLHKKYIEKIPKGIWIVTATLFIDSKGHLFNKTKFRTQKNPSRADLIEEAIQLLD